MGEREGDRDREKDRQTDGERERVTIIPMLGFELRQRLVCTETSVTIVTGV